MNRLLRDLVRSIRTPGVLIAIVLLVLGGAVVSELFASAAAVGYGGYSMTVLYNESRGYQLTIFVFEGNGHAIDSASISLVVTGPTPPGSVLFNRTEKSDFRGFAIFAWPGPEGNPNNGTGDNYDLKVISSYGSSETQAPLINPSPNSPLGSGTIHLISVGSFVVTPYIQVSFGYANGSVPKGTSLQYDYSVETGNMGEGFIGYVGNVTTNPERFRVSLPAAAMAPAEILTFMLVNSSGAEVDGNDYAASSLNVTSGPQTAEGSALATADSYLSLLVPFAAVIVADVEYGRDRLSGALEPLIALPLTRRRILLQRYVSSVLVLSGASTVALAEFEWQAAAHSISVPGVLFAGLWTSTIFLGVVFLSLTFLFSHVLRSQGSVMATGIGLVLVFGALWGLLVLLVATFAGISDTVTSQVIWQAHVGFANPVSVGQGILSLSLWSLHPSSQLLFPAVTNVAIEAGVAVAWIVLPLLGAVLLMTYRD
jgi:ABC-type transport system involved in multi-copper enzyme maturation permease subunit